MHFLNFQRRLKNESLKTLFVTVNVFERFIFSFNSFISDKFSEKNELEEKIKEEVSSPLKNSKRQREKAASATV